MNGFDTRVVAGGAHSQFPLHVADFLDRRHFTQPEARGECTVEAAGDDLLADFRAALAADDFQHTEALHTVFAGAALKHALQLHPTYADALVQLGLLHYQRRETPQAVSSWEKALTADPANVLAQIYLRMAREGGAGN